MILPNKSILSYIYQNTYEDTQINTNKLSYQNQYKDTPIYIMSQYSVKRIYINSPKKSEKNK